MSRDFYNYKRKVVAAAKELHYGTSVIESLWSATTETELERIMVTARKKMDD